MGLDRLLIGYFRILHSLGWFFFVVNWNGLFLRKSVRRPDNNIIVFWNKYGVQEPLTLTFFLALETKFLDSDWICLQNRS